MREGLLLFAVIISAGGVGFAVAALMALPALPAKPEAAVAPLSVPHVEVEWTDFDDMSELRTYETSTDRWQFKWYTKEGRHLVYVVCDWWSPDDSDAYPRLEDMRERARQAIA